MAPTPKNNKGSATQRPGTAVFHPKAFDLSPRKKTTPVIGFKKVPPTVVRPGTAVPTKEDVTREQGKPSQRGPLKAEVVKAFKPQVSQAAQEKPKIKQTYIKKAITTVGAQNGPVFRPQSSQLSSASQKPKPEQK